MEEKLIWEEIRRIYRKMDDNATRIAQKQAYMSGESTAYRKSLDKTLSGMGDTMNRFLESANRKCERHSNDIKWLHRSNAGELVLIGLLFAATIVLALGG